MAPTFGGVLKARAASDAGGDEAIRYPDGALSWRVFETRTAALAQRLIDRGVKTNDLVAVALPNGVDHHIASFAVWRAGATPCVLPAKLPGREFSQLIELARPRALIGGGGETPDAVVRIDPDAGNTPVDLADDIAAANWKAVTSGGSTGRPKLIVDHAEARFGDRLPGICDLAGIPRGGVMLNPGPLYHNAPFLFTNLALLCGTRVVGMSRFDAEEALRLIEREKVEWVCMVPTMMHRIWSLAAEVRAKYDLSSLRRVLHLASPCPPWLKRAWIDWLGADRIVEIYAGTEGPSTMITGEEWLRKPGSVGRVSRDAVTILDEAGRSCLPGEVGEIFFAPDTVERFRYIGAERRTDEAGRMSLGDLGYLDEDDYLFLSDRRIDLILRGGANIYPAEVEAALIEHPAVVDAVVVGLPCDELGARIHAIVRLAGNVPVEAIDTFVRGRIASYKCPASYETTEADLRDEAGKVRRSALRKERLE